MGPRNPLAQTLADVVVTVGDRLLPLLFVSPQQINAQVLSDVPDGEHTLRVRWTGKPDVTGTFVVSRNSPGLFSVLGDSDLKYSIRSTVQDSVLTIRRSSTGSSFRNHPVSSSWIRLR
jgi:uncharacterized protein (TIGR03437 family)